MGRAAGIAGAWEVCVCARESRKSSAADGSGESSHPALGAQVTRGAAQPAPVRVFTHLNSVWEAVLPQPGLSAGR